MVLRGGPIDLDSYLAVFGWVFLREFNLELNFSIESLLLWKMSRSKISQFSHMERAINEMVSMFCCLTRDSGRR